MPNVNRILSAKTPLTLAGLTRGAQPLVLADLARAAGHRDGRAIFIAPDEAAMRSIADAAHVFAPELEVIEFPAWDCLPYDRASPALSVSARRLAALHRLQQPRSGPQLFVTTINAALQRVLTPFRIRESVRLLKPGVEIGRNSLTALLSRQGYARTDTVADAGEYAVRGSIFDIYPSGLDSGLRLDFFGDEIETLRLFAPDELEAMICGQARERSPAAAGSSTLGTPTTTTCCSRWMAPRWTVRERAATPGPAAFGC